MKFEKVVVVESKKNTSEHLESSKKLMKALNGFDFFWTFYDNLKKEKMHNADLVITLGGDGTFIEAANRIEDSYILGINSHPSSSEGALTSLSMNEVGKLEEILNRELNVIERQRAKVKLNGEVLDERASNEVYVGAENNFHTSRYIINYRDKKEEQRSSGVIISTGTGSSGWFKSAGGKQFNANEKKLGFIVREPYYGERVYVSTVLGGDILSDEKISFESKRDSGGIIAIGFKLYDFNEGDIVEIKLSEKPLRVIEGF
ncbi:NAD(+)/NADH kinase [Candidatus Pacearchaeota archaeon]|nr:NAD(+)/NADH kinase [Candidatus Pacearchaeota archaeon]